jgi:1-acyl-sn-glycerol-3-phosphate acyltransferase
MAGVRVQPLGLHYADTAQAVVPFVGDDAFVPHLLRLLREEFIEVKVQAHGLIPETASAGEMARHARETIQNGIQMQTRSSALKSGLISLQTLDTAFSDYSPQKSG